MALVALTAHLTTNSTTGAPYLEPLEVSATLTASSTLTATKLQPTFLAATLTAGSAVASTLQPYPIVGLLHAGSAVVADAHKQGQGTAFHADAQVFGDSSVFVPGVLSVQAHLVGNSSLTFLHIPLAAAITANSTLTDGYNLSANLLSDSTVTADHLEPVSTAANLVGDSSIGGHLTPVDVAANIVANSTHLFDAPGTRFLAANIVANSEVVVDSAILLYAQIVASSFCELDTGVVSLAAELSGGSSLVAVPAVSFALATHIIGGSVLQATETLSLVAVPVSPTKIRVIFPFAMKNDVNLNDPANYTVMNSLGGFLAVASVQPETVTNTMVVDVLLGVPLMSNHGYQLTVATTIQPQ